MGPYNCLNPRNRDITFLFKGIDLVSFYDFSIGCWNCSESVIYFVFLFIRSLHPMSYFWGPEWLNELGSWITNNSYKPITNTAWVRARICKLQKRWTRLSAASDKVYQLLVHGRWFSPASSAAKTGRHEIDEILLKVALNTKIH